MAVEAMCMYGYYLVYQGRTIFLAIEVEGGLRRDSEMGGGYDELLSAACFLG